MAKTDKHEELDEATADWIKKQEELMDEGERIIREASNEALEYVADAVENINDKQWRKMVMESQAVEMGVGIGMAEYLIPQIYNDMAKNIHKKLKLPKETGVALRHVYIGRVMKNVRKAINVRDK